MRPKQYNKEHYKTHLKDAFIQVTDPDGKTELFMNVTSAAEYIGVNRSGVYDILNYTPDKTIKGYSVRAVDMKEFVITKK